MPEPDAESISSLKDGTLLPSIVESPPGPRSRRLAERLGKVETPTSSIIARGEVPVFWERSRGANVMDVDGNVYIDLTSGFCVALAGHSNPRIARAISQQSDVLLHSQGGLNPNPLRVELAERLAQLAPGELSVSHISNTGAEAVEMALKTARIYTGRPTVIAFHGGFHGKTTGALSVTSHNYYRQPFLSTLPGVVHVPYGYSYRCPTHPAEGRCPICSGDYLAYLLENPDSGIADVAAIIVEPVQGHGGWVVPPPEFVQAIRQLCNKYGILMIADEIITGFGRTGRWFGMDHFEVVPDILVVGKGLASGFPISAMITTPDIAAAWKPMQHTSTFLGHPVGCAASLASLAEIEERELVQRSAELGAYFRGELEKLQQAHPLIGEVRGLGLMVGIELVKDRTTREPASEAGAKVVASMLRRGVMATNYGGTYHNVIKMSPPLVITQGQLDVSLEILDEAFREIEAEL